MTAHGTKTGSPTSPAEDQTALRRLGSVVRGLRRTRGLSRAALADRSGLSLRFLAQLEAGEGNISFLRLRHLARALETDAARLIERAQAPARPPVALLGLRGAGKSTVGRALADTLGIPFRELDELVEIEAGMTLGQIFDLQGEAMFRRLERDALRRFLDAGEDAVLATGGGIVTQPETFELLQRRAITVWLKASPDTHWQRVVAQGDERPMRDRPHAMTELEALWSDRARGYGAADVVVDTENRTVPEAVQTIELEVRDRTPDTGAT